MFSRIARAVRQTIALEAKLASDLRALTDRLQAEAASQAQAAARGLFNAHKATVRRAVARAIHLEVHDDQDEDLLDALDDHLDDWSADARFLEKPIGELVMRICNDLGLSASPSLWEDDDWAVEETDRLSPAKREAEGRERAGSGFATAAQGPAMRDPSIRCHPGKRAALVRDP